MGYEFLRTVVWTVAATILIVDPATGQMNKDVEAESEQAESAPADEQSGGQVIEGLVLNYYGGGITGARIRVEALNAKPGDPPIAEGESGKGGEIRIRLPNRVNENVRVRIQMDGYQEFVQEVDPTDPETPAFVDAALQGAGTISGVVRARSSGKPVANARVLGESGGRETAARTDAEGKYTLTGIVRGRARLKVVADGFATFRTILDIDEQDTEEDIDLFAELPVELLVVTSDGDPAEKVLIEGWIESTRSSVEAMSDAKGRATLRGIGEEVDEIRLRLNGERYVRMAGFDERLYLTASQPAAETMPATTRPALHRIIVNIAAKVRGKITDDKDEPLAGVRVSAGRKSRSDMPVTWTDLDGEYELSGLPAGLITVTFQHPDCAADVREVSLNAGQTGTLDAKLNTGEAIAGTVVGPDDEPIEQAWVVLEEWKGYQTIGMRASTDKEGKFSFEHAPEGELVFTVVKAGFGGPIRQTMAAGKTDYRIVLDEVATPAVAGGGPGLTGVKIPVGQTVPDFTLVGVDGTKYKLSELKGKYVFLDFWASWCPPCQKEMPNVKALYEAMKNESGFVLVGVSLDTEEKDFKEAVSQKKTDWPQVWGPESGAEETFEMLDGLGIPYTCLIGPDGRMLAQHIFGPGTTEQVKKLVKN